MKSSRSNPAAFASGSPARALVMSTFAFAMCFAVWLLYGPLLKFLSQSGRYEFTPEQLGALIAAPVLTGALLRLPVGLLTDRFGGRPVFVGVMLISTAGLGVVYLADSFLGFFIAGLLFGTAGATFAVGIAYTSLWFPKQRQGTALGLFGMGNGGAAITLLCGPSLLTWLTSAGTAPDNWRSMPLIYAGALLATTAVFWGLTTNRKPEASARKTLFDRLQPLKQLRVWRFGLYYFLVFGAFVGLSAWLVQYYVDVYDVPLATAGLLATLFSLPSSLIRAVGGWLSDRVGARRILYWVLGACVLTTSVLSLPVDVVTFTALVCVLGIAMGIGMAAVYKHIPVYFPQEVGVVGGIVGVLGGLGGFACPLAFGFLLSASTSPEQPTGAWPTAFMFLCTLSIGSLAWMHAVIVSLGRSQSKRPTRGHDAAKLGGSSTLALHAAPSDCTRSRTSIAGLGTAPRRLSREKERENQEITCPASVQGTGTVPRSGTTVTG